MLLDGRKYGVGALALSIPTVALAATSDAGPLASEVTWPLAAVWIAAVLGDAMRSGVVVTVRHQNQRE